MELLLCEDQDEAAELAEELERRNQARKAEEVRILEEIAEQAAENPRLLKERVLVFAGEGWHHGVIGIAASRLEEQFGKPTILITLEGDRARGSMRSFGAFFCVSLPARVSGIAVTLWRSPRCRRIFFADRACRAIPAGGTAIRQGVQSGHAGADTGGG